MARYLQTAAEANVVAKELFNLVTSYDVDSLTEAEYKFDVAKSIAQLVNYGLRCAPRAVQHTVRLRAVEAAVKDLPVIVSMCEKTDEKTGRSYNVLVYRK